MERTSRASSSLRRRSSLSLSGHIINNPDDDAESVSAAEAGDIGDRALSSNRLSEAGSIHYSFDNVSESGSYVFPISEDDKAQPTQAGQNSMLPVTVFPQDLNSPAPTDALVISGNPTSQVSDKSLPRSLEYISCLIHLAVFGILGVLTRYLLQKLFGPGVAGVTSDQTVLYLDLPSNMVGSFLMGWFGVVFKGNISHFSDVLAIGLTTGYLGSLTTFSGWNQKMLDLSVSGHWVSAVLGFLVGLFLVGYAIIFGIDTAKVFKCYLNSINSSTGSGISSSKINWTCDSRKRQLAALVVLLLMLGLFWGLSGALLKEEFHDNGSRAQLWLACLVAPLGVWIRWYLSRFNGRGLGKAGQCKWIPFGTLLANVSAACLMAALSAIKRAVSTKTCDTVATGLQFGLLGCLSTVSTFVAEFNALRENKNPWRPYAYAIMTILISFALGTLIYSVPVWTKCI